VIELLATTFAEEMSALKVKRGLSWAELARRVNVSSTYLKDISYGRRGQGVPSEPIVAAIADAFDVSEDHFLLTRARAVLASPDAIDAGYKHLRKTATKTAA